MTRSWPERRVSWSRTILVRDRLSNRGGIRNRIYERVSLSLPYLRIPKKTLCSKSRFVHFNIVFIPFVHRRHESPGKKDSIEKYSGSLTFFYVRPCFTVACLP